jgi:hypothetical protein
LDDLRAGEPAVDVVVEVLADVADDEERLGRGHDQHEEPQEGPEHQPIEDAHHQGVSGSV